MHNGTIIRVMLTDKERALYTNSEWAMYSEEGGRMVGNCFMSLVEQGVVVIPKTGGVLVYDFGKTVYETVRALVEPHHGEVADTEVRELVWGRAEDLLNERN